MTESAVHTATDPIAHQPTSPVPAPRRGRLLGFAAGAAFMCVLSAGVGAGAATLVTSAQIKDGTIVGRDVKDGGLTGKDIKSSSLTGKQVKDGSIAGADVKDGGIGSADIADGGITSGDIADGTIASDDLSASARAALVQPLIPSGTTVTGTGYFDIQASVNGDFGFDIALPGRAHADLTDQMVNFRTGNNPIFNDDTNSCAGSASFPSAPPGQVCLYLIASATDSTNIRGSSVYNNASDQSFAVRWSDSNSGSDVYVSLVWAYTAP